MSKTNSTEQTALAEAKEKAELVAEFADDIKAERIELMDVRKKTSITSYMVVCSGNSDVHVKAIAERIAEKMREKGHKPSKRSLGDGASGWLLLDYGDVIVHVMLEDKRQFYDLESLWAGMPENPDLIGSDG